MAACLRPCLCKDTHDLGFEFREFDGKNRAAGMKDEVSVAWQQVEMTAQHFAHAPLDAIALVGFANDFACGETDAGASSNCILIRRVIEVVVHRQKPTHRWRLALPCNGVGSLIVRVFTQAHARKRLRGSAARV